MKKKLAIIGAGNVACNSYLPYLVKRDDVELIIQSRTMEKAKSAAERSHSEPTPLSIPLPRILRSRSGGRRAEVSGQRSK